MYKRTMGLISFLAEVAAAWWIYEGCGSLLNS